MHFRRRRARYECRGIWRGLPRAGLAFAVWLASIALSRAVAADDGTPSRFEHWMDSHSEWLLGREPFKPYEIQRLWFAYAVLGSALMILELGAEPPSGAKWEGDNGFDDEVRDLLKGESRSARDAADTASDVLLGGLGVALLFDGAWLRRETPVLRSFLFDGSWLLTNELVTRGAKVSAGRERPYVDPCSSDSGYVSDCNEGRDRNASFFSAHASRTATMAGLICSRHLSRRRFAWPDWLTCGAAAAASATTGALRITSESHHATDILAGWASGVIVGYVLPSHFDRRPRRENPVFPLLPVDPVATPHFLGLRLQFSF